MRIYIAGPISGRPNRNAQAFADAAARCRVLGHAPLNPIEAAGETPLAWGPALRLGFELLLSADALALLPGWEASRGATLEVAVATALGLPLLDAASPDLAPLEPVQPRWRIDRSGATGAALEGTLWSLPTPPPARPEHA